MMEMGWVGALPVNDVDAALSAIENELGPPEVEDGLRSHETRTGVRVHLRAARDYLLFGQKPAAVRRAELGRLLDLGDLPPGSVALDVDLVPVTPMIQLGMATARQTVAGNLGLAESDTADQAAAMSMYDFYVGLANDLLLNVSRIQVSLEVGTSDLTIHEWLLPRSDSTLGEMLRAQKGGFPDLARGLPADSSVAVMAAGIEITDRARTAMRAYVARYNDFMESIGQTMSGDEAQWFEGFMGPWSKNAVQWADCTRGDTAAVYRFSEARGFSATQVAGLTDGERCGELLEEVGRAMTELPALPDGRVLASVQSEALVHEGVPAMRLEVDMLAGHGEQDPEALEFAERLFGSDGFVYYMGQKGDTLISAAGSGSEQAFRDTVDGLSARRKRGGLSPKHFAPLKPENGIFFAVDVAALMREAARFDPDDADLRELGAMAERAGRWVMGASFASRALRIETNLPHSAIGLLAELGDDGDDASAGEGASPTDSGSVSPGTKNDR
jgi:hypothetical protein